MASEQPARVSALNSPICCLGWVEFLMQLLPALLKLSQGPTSPSPSLGGLHSSAARGGASIRAAWPVLLPPWTDPATGKDHHWTTTVTATAATEPPPSCGAAGGLVISPQEPLRWGQGMGRKGQRGFLVPHSCPAGLDSTAHPGQALSFNPRELCGLRCEGPEPEPVLLAAASNPKVPTTATPPPPGAHLRGVGVPESQTGRLALLQKPSRPGVCCLPELWPTQ